MTLKYIVVTIILTCFAGFASAQNSGLFKSADEVTEDNRQFDRNRMYYGGYLNMNFSKNYSVIGAQPLIAYKLTPEFSLGTQLSYEYISDSRYYNKQNGSNYGASLFGRYRITPLFYAHTELALMSYKWFYTDGSDERKLAPMIYVGGGFSQPISENTWLNAQILFDVLNHENSPYEEWEPYYSIGFGVGF